MSINELLTYSYVITINDLQYDIFNQRFHIANLDNPLPKKFKGIQLKNDIYKKAGFIKTNNIINCTLSHMSIISMAKTLNFPFICIFEEDAYPSINAKNELNIILSNIPSDCDCLRIGYRIVEQLNNSILNQNFLKAKAYGSHAQIIFKRYYDDILNIYNNDPIADTTALNNKKHNILLSNPCIFIQNNNFCENALHKDKPNKQYKRVYEYQNRWYLNQ